MNNLLSWALSQGAYINKVRPHKTLDRHFEAAEDIFIQDVLFELPQPLLMHAGRALDDKTYGSSFRALAAEAGASLDQRSLLMLFMVVERAKDGDSFWAPYLDILPATYDDPLWWDEPTKHLVRGTQLAVAMDQYQSGLTALGTWMQRLHQLSRQLAPPGEEPPSHLETYKGGWALTPAAPRWARSAVWSRSFTLHRLAPSSQLHGTEVSTKSEHQTVEVAEGQKMGMHGNDVHTDVLPTKADGLVANAMARDSDMAGNGSETSVVMEAAERLRNGSGACATGIVHAEVNPLQGGDRIGLQSEVVSVGSGSAFIQSMSGTRHVATEGSRAGVVAMLPVIDMLDHDPSAGSGWHTGPDGSQPLQYVALTPVKQGSIPYNNYGSKPNDELLLAYGFLLEDNPADYFRVAITGPRPAPISITDDDEDEAARHAQSSTEHVQRMALLDAAGIGHEHRLTASEPLPASLLTSARLSGASQQAIYAAFAKSITPVNHNSSAAGLHPDEVPSLPTSHNVQMDSSLRPLPLAGDSIHDNGTEPLSQAGLPPNWGLAQELQMLTSVRLQLEIKLQAMATESELEAVTAVGNPIPATRQTAQTSDRNDKIDTTDLIMVIAEATGSAHCIEAEIPRLRQVASDLPVQEPSCTGISSEPSSLCVSAAETPLVTASAGGSERMRQQRLAVQYVRGQRRILETSLREMESQITSIVQEVSQQHSNPPCISELHHRDSSVTPQWEMMSTSGKHNAFDACLVEVRDCCSSRPDPPCSLHDDLELRSQSGMQTETLLSPQAQGILHEALGLQVMLQSELLHDTPKTDVRATHAASGLHMPKPEMHCTANIEVDHATGSCSKCSPDLPTGLMFSLGAAVQPPCPFSYGGACQRDVTVGECVMQVPLNDCFYAATTSQLRQQLLLATWQHYQRPHQSPSSVPTEPQIAAAGTKACPCGLSICPQCLASTQGGLQDAVNGTNRDRVECTEVNTSGEGTNEALLERLASTVMASPAAVMQVAVQEEPWLKHHPWRHVIRLLEGTSLGAAVEGLCEELEEAWQADAQELVQKLKHCEANAQGVHDGHDANGLASSSGGMGPFTMVQDANVDNGAGRVGSGCAEWLQEEGGSASSTKTAAAAANASVSARTTETAAEVRVVAAETMTATVAAAGGTVTAAATEILSLPAAVTVGATMDGALSSAVAAVGEGATANGALPSATAAGTAAANEAPSSAAALPTSAVTNGQHTEGTCNNNIQRMAPHSNKVTANAIRGLLPCPHAFPLYCWVHRVVETCSMPVERDQTSSNRGLAPVQISDRVILPVFWAVPEVLRSAFRVSIVPTGLVRVTARHPLPAFPAAVLSPRSLAPSMSAEDLFLQYGPCSHAGTRSPEVVYELYVSPAPGDPLMGDKLNLLAASGAGLSHYLSADLAGEALLLLALAVCLDDGALLAEPKVQLLLEAWKSSSPQEINKLQPPQDTASTPQSTCSLAAKQIWADAEFCAQYCNDRIRAHCFNILKGARKSILKHAAKANQLAAPGTGSQSSKNEQGIYESGKDMGILNYVSGYLDALTKVLDSWVHRMDVNQARSGNKKEKRKQGEKDSSEKARKKVK